MNSFLYLCKIYIYIYIFFLLIFHSFQNNADTGCTTDIPEEKDKEGGKKEDKEEEEADMKEFLSLLSPNETRDMGPRESKLL